MYYRENIRKISYIKNDLKYYQKYKQYCKNIYIWEQYCIGPTQTPKTKLIHDYKINKFNKSNEKKNLGNLKKKYLH